MDLEPEEESRSSQLNPLWHLPHENCEFCHISLSLDEACGATKWIAPSGAFLARRFTSGCSKHQASRDTQISTMSMPTATQATDRTPPTPPTIMHLTPALRIYGLTKGTNVFLVIKSR